MRQKGDSELCRNFGALASARMNPVLTGWAMLCSRLWR